MGHAAKINFVPENVTLALYAGDGANILIKVKDPTGNAVPLDGRISKFKFGPAFARCISAAGRDSPGSRSENVSLARQISG